MSSELGDVGSESKELLGVATTRFTVGRSEISSNSHRPAAVTARAWVSYAALRHYGLTPTQVAESLGFRAKASCGVLSAPKHSLSTPTKSPARSGRDSLPPSTGTPPASTFFSSAHSATNFRTFRTHVPPSRQPIARFSSLAIERRTSVPSGPTAR